MSKDKPLLQRWSQRKKQSQNPVDTKAHGGAMPGVMMTEPLVPEDPDLAVIDEAPEDARADADGSEALVVAAVDADDTDQVNVEDLPDVETMTAESDFSVFMKKGVPEELKNLALRKLWLSNPIFANLDGMNDYDEDFRVIDKLITLADTGYKPGKGFMTEEDWAQYKDDDEDDLGDAEDGDLVEDVSRDGPDKDADPEPAQALESDEGIEDEGDPEVAEASDFSKPAEP